MIRKVIAGTHVPVPVMENEKDLARPPVEPVPPAVVKGN